MARCKHGIDKDCCSICNPPLWKIEKQKSDRRIFGKSRKNPKKSKRGSLSQSQSDPFYVLIHSKRGHPRFTDLSQMTTIVHIHGFPFLWCLEEIIEKAPNVKIIEIIPSHLQRITKSHHEWAKKHRVEINGGHWWSELAWQEGEMRHQKAYYKQKFFLENLQGEQKKLFSELEKFELLVVNMALDYYGLCGVPLTQLEIAEKYNTVEHYASTMINGLLYYLDPEQFKEVSQQAITYASILEKRVQRLNKYFEDIESKAKIEKRFRKLGLEKIPNGIALFQLSLLEKIINARNNKKWSSIKPRNQKIIMARFGLDNSENPRYKTLREVGDLFDLTREAVRQIIQRSFKKLGIEIDGENDI